MDFKIAVLLLAGTQLCAALPFPCECTRQLQPVCGSDGQTYNSICLLNCAQAASNSGIILAKHGACVETNTGICGCSLAYDPVCGSDGSTYPNVCHIQCKSTGNPSLYRAYTGECDYTTIPTVSNSKNCNCATDYIPVCVSNGRTYRNASHASCHSKLGVAYDGSCKSVPRPNVCDCGNVNRPVCGSDNVTYANVCLLNCATAYDPTLRVVDYFPCKM